MSGCSILIPIEYKEGHDKMGHYFHWKICEYNSISKYEKWYEHQPEVFIEAREATIISVFASQTDRK